MSQPEDQPHAGGKHLIHDKEKNGAINTITNTIPVVTIVSLRVGHVTRETSCRTC